MPSNGAVSCRDRCGFFSKYRETKDLAWRGFIWKYCKGEKMDECKRKASRKMHGSPPPDNMMPSGQLIAA